MAVLDAQRDNTTSLGVIVETDVPARLDRLPWGRFHTLVVAALGITWILDGLEVTLVGAVAGALKQSPVLQFSNTDIGLAGSAYLAGAVLGALFFGWLTDRIGRKKLFFVTLTVYLIATAATALLLEFLELHRVPLRDRRRHRRRVRGDQLDHPGADPGPRTRLDRSRHQRQLLAGRGHRRRGVDRPARSGIPAGRHRLARGVCDRGAAQHGHLRDAHVDSGKPALAGHARSRRGSRSDRGRHRGQPAPAGTRAERRALCRAFACDALAYAIAGGRSRALHAQRQRSLVGLSLMAAQAFFYNAIFFTYALILTDFYAVPADHVGWYILPFAAGNFLGPLLLGRLFDTWGRRPMIAITYAISGLLLAGTGFLFAQDVVSVRRLTVAWSVIFFFASAAASSAYLTVSETFPLEIRALAIAVFYAVGTGVGGVIGPWLMGALIETGSRPSVFAGYLLGAVLMLAAAGVMLRWGIAAERKPLEEVSRPLAAAD